MFIDMDRHIIVELGGWLATSIGAKWVYAGSLCTSSLATLALTTMYMLPSTHLSLLFALRFLIGLAHGVLFPATISLWSLWAVPQERSTLASIGFCGTHLGTSMTMLFGGIFCRYFHSGWMYLFVQSGIIGFIWLALWIVFTADSPSHHPTISNHERDYICNLTGNKGGKRTMSLSSMPWKNIVTSKPLLALFTTHIANLFGLFFFLTNLGKILTELLRIPTQYTGYILSFGFSLTLLSSLSSGRSSHAQSTMSIHVRLMWFV
jgi:MFS family permease